jgi:hypothetical protein
VLAAEPTKRWTRRWEVGGGVPGYVKPHGRLNFDVFAVSTSVQGMEAETEARSGTVLLGDGELKLR